MTSRAHWRTPKKSTVTSERYTRARQDSSCNKSGHARTSRRERSNLQTEAAKATRSAEEDILTGIGNRRLLERFLCEEAVRQTEVACIIADIDSFKEINDTFGHDVGDAVLRQVGQLFLSKARSGQLAIRYGGDEFVVALSGVDLAGAYGFAERLRLAVSEP